MITLAIIIITILLALLILGLAAIIGFSWILALPLIVDISLFIWLITRLFQKKKDWYSKQRYGRLRWVSYIFAHKKPLSIWEELRGEYPA